MPETLNGHVPDVGQASETPVAKKIAQMCEEMEALLRQRQEERAAIQARHAQELAAIHQDIDALQSTVRALTGTKPKIKAKKQQPGHIGIRRASGTATGFGITFEVAQVAVDAIKNELPEKFTQRQLYRHLDWDQAKTSQAVRFLREIGFLRKAGKADDKRAVLWAVMDADAFERARNEVSNATEE
jgi:DNA-binding protein H-NS